MMRCAPDIITFILAVNYYIRCMFNLIRSIDILKYTCISGVVFGVLLLHSCHAVKEGGYRNKDGFISIFDGRTLANWVGDTTYWRVEDSCLVGTVTPETLLKRNSFIIWQGNMPD